jgi:hypothetical protein
MIECRYNGPLRQVKVAEIANSIRQSGLLDKESWNYSDEEKLIDIMGGVVLIDMVECNGEDSDTYSEFKQRYSKYLDRHPALKSKV